MGLMDGGVGGETFDELLRIPRAPVEGVLLGASEDVFDAVGEVVSFRLAFAAFSAPINSPCPILGC